MIGYYGIDTIDSQNKNNTVVYYTPPTPQITTTLGAVTLPTPNFWLNTDHLSATQSLLQALERNRFRKKSVSEK